MHTDAVSTHLHRLNWLLHARAVEAKLRELESKPASIPTSLRAILTAGNGPVGEWGCLDLCYPLLERPQHPASCGGQSFGLSKVPSDRNEWDFHRWINACLQRRTRVMRGRLPAPIDGVNTALIDRGLAAQPELEDRIEAELAEFGRIR